MRDQMMVLPFGQVYRHLRTGKFKALDAHWKHERFPLTVDYELIVMTEGVLYLSYMGERYTVRKGEYLLLPPSESMREGFKESYCAFYWLHFTTPVSGLPPVVTLPDAPGWMTREDCVLLPPSGVLPRIEKLVVQMKQLQDTVRNGYPRASLDAMTTSIVLELYGQLSTGAPAEVEPAERKQIYMDIIDYINRNLTNNIKISEIADVFGYNPKYLSHLFAEIRGIPLKQFIMNQKIDAANFMLADNDRTVTEIAERLGFSDVHNFARTYKKHTGLTPSEYRDAYAKRMLYHV
ncbi:MAG: helix-turn-helix domain-containing protein [Butyrivibrio sp.]|nr:helix-turn-helix domain-containing protein [Butyrivibrio sp.]